MTTSKADKTVTETTIKPYGTQAELQKETLEIVGERDDDTSDKPAPVNGAAPLSHGYDDGAQLGGAHERASAVEVDDALPGETGQDEAQADSDNLRVDAPFTDEGRKGDALSAEAHEMDEVTKPQLREPTKGEVALHYATELNWHVFPLHYILEDGSCSCGKSDCIRSAGKHPLTRHGVKDATLDPDQIERWWRRWPDANIGIATGPSQLLVIDLDQKPEKGKDGAAAWAKLQAEHEPAPETLAQITGSGGTHLIFDRAGYEGEIASWKSADGLDGRAEGGYIVVAPGKGTRTAPTPGKTQARG